MIEINWNPDRWQLRDFAVMFLVSFAALGLLRAWHKGLFASGTSIGWQGPWLVPMILWTAGIIVGLLGMIVPWAVRPLYLAWMAVAFPISWTVSHVLLAVTYFGVFAIFGTLFRLIGRDELRRSFDKNAKTYWQDREPNTDIARYLKQY